VPKWLSGLLKRLAWIAILAVFTAGFWAPFVIRYFVEKDYSFPEVTIDATVRPNGDLLLEERRTFDFHNGPFSNAYFQVDDPNDGVKDFSMAEVNTDGSETPVTPDWANPTPYGYFEARWSYSAEDEERTWVFRYRVERAVDAYADTAHLYWQFIGTGWEKPTGHAVITVHLPGTLQPSEVRAFGHGPLNGEVSFVDPQTVRFEANDIPPLNFVEGSILFPVSVVPGANVQPVSKLQETLDQEGRWAAEANALRDRHELQRGWVLGLLIAVPLVLALFVLMGRFRDRIVEAPRTLEQPPEDDAVQGSLLWSAWLGHLLPQNAYRTQLLHLANVGAIELKAEGRVSDPKDITLVRKKDPSDLESKTDRDFMTLLFGKDVDAVEEVSIRHPKPKSVGSEAPFKRYSVWWNGVKARSGDVLRRIQKGDARIESTGSAIVAVSSGLYGIWTAKFGVGGPVGWWLVPEALVSLYLALRIIPARVERPIRERIAKLAAFRRFLKRFSDLPNAPAMAVIIWEQYLEWAVALGVAAQVEKQVRALVPVESLRSPIPGGPTGLAGFNAFQNMNAAAPSIVHSSMQSAASSGSYSGGFGSSSSSGGFSGGGFSGGGGGGGGGTGGGAG
jgi:uncharacterized membrane protein